MNSFTLRFPFGSAPEAEEDGQVVVVDLRVEIRAHRTIRVIPVAEAKPVMPGVSAKIDNYAHQQQADESNDFDAAEPELQFTKDTKPQERVTSAPGSSVCVWYEFMSSWVCLTGVDRLLGGLALHQAHSMCISYTYGILNSRHCRVISTGITKP